MREIAAPALAAMARGEPVALVSVLATEGSAPRGAGTRMAVTQGGIIGTIGGGNLEYQAIRQARAILAQPAGEWRVQDYPLGPLLGQCCGGRVRLLVEHLDPAHSDWMLLGASRIEAKFNPGDIERYVVRASSAETVTARGPAPKAGDRIAEPLATLTTPLTLFGAGHVGQALARLIPGLPFTLAWRDSREGLAGVADLSIKAPEALEAEARTATGAVLIMTHDHALDFQLTLAALTGPATFVGLIGSATKRARFLRRLREAGVTEDQLARLTCPIGVPDIRGKEPAVIAIAVAAQLLALFPGSVD